MPYPIDTYRDAFLRFMTEGCSYREALEHFDEKEFRSAAMEELDGDLVRRIGPLEDIIRAGDFVTNDQRGLPALLDLLTHAEFEKRNSVDSPDYQQALDLWQAGWTSENANPASPGFWGQTQVMSWYWRAPSKRAGKPGRRYLSTNQAWNALQKEAAR